MKIAKQYLNQIIQEEIQKMLIEVGCPEGMRDEGSQCVGAAPSNPDDKTVVYRVASQGAGKGGYGGYTGTDEAPTRDASEFEINRAKYDVTKAKAVERSKANTAHRQEREDAKTPEEKRSAEILTKGLAAFGGAISNMGAMKI